MLRYNRCFLANESKVKHCRDFHPHDNDRKYIYDATLVVFLFQSNRLRLNVEPHRLASTALGVDLNKLAVPFSLVYLIPQLLAVSHISTP